MAIRITMPSPVGLIFCLRLEIFTFKSISPKPTVAFADYTYISHMSNRIVPVSVTLQQPYTWQLRQVSSGMSSG